MLKTMYDIVTGKEPSKSIYKERASHIETEMDNLRNEFAQNQYLLLLKVEALIKEMEKTINKSSADDKYIENVNQRKSYLERRLKECQLL